MLYYLGLRLAYLATCRILVANIGWNEEILCNGTFFGAPARLTYTRPMTLGRICLIVMWMSEPPAARAASMNDLSFKLRTWLRTVRLKPIQPSRLMTSMMLRTLWPRMAMRMRSRGRNGITRAHNDEEDFFEARERGLLPASL